MRPKTTNSGEVFKTFICPTSGTSALILLLVFLGLLVATPSRNTYAYDRQTYITACRAWVSFRKKGPILKTVSTISPAELCGYLRGVNMKFSALGGHDVSSALQISPSIIRNIDWGNLTLRIARLIDRHKTLLVQFPFLLNTGWIYPNMTKEMRDYHLSDIWWFMSKIPARNFSSTLEAANFIMEVSIISRIDLNIQFGKPSPPDYYSRLVNDIVTYNLSDIKKIWSQDYSASLTALVIYMQLKKLGIDTKKVGLFNKAIDEIANPRTAGSKKVE